MDQFEEIYLEYFPRVYAFLLRLSKDEQTAEDLTQETFYQAFNSFHRYRGESGIFTWLAAIAKHTYYKYLRKHKLAVGDISLELVAEALIQPGATPEAEVERDATNAAIRKMIEEMPEKYRDVVILRIYADMPFSEVARTLKISESSAKVIFFRAKKMLLEEIKNEFEL